MTTWLQHGRVRLALHGVRGGEGRPLLLLHALGAATTKGLPEELEAWPGPVFGLDFTGHGESDVPSGGGYTAEILMSDVDMALEHLGPCTLLGSGLGAYVGLLVAGARPSLVRGLILCDGPGLAGGGPWPGPTRILQAQASDASPDPFAILELSSTCGRPTTRPTSCPWPSRARVCPDRSASAPPSGRPGSRASRVRPGPT